MDMTAVSIQDLLDEETVRERSTPTNFRLGQAILQIGRVDLIEMASDRISARVTGGQRRKVSFWAEDAELQWRCSCTLKQQHIFCKHCVALALTVIRHQETAE